MACETHSQAFMSSADALLVLKDEKDMELPVHSLFLEQKSQVLDEAVRIAKQERIRNDKIRLPLASVEGKAAELFVKFIYAQLPEAFAEGLQNAEIWSLVQLCHQYDCQQLLSALDKALVKHLSPGSPRSSLQPATAVKTMEQAQALGLPDFEVACGHYLGKHAQAVLKAGAPIGGVGALLQHAADTAAAIGGLSNAVELLNSAKSDVSTRKAVHHINSYIDQAIFWINRVRSG